MNAAREEALLVWVAENPGVHAELRLIPGRQEWTVSHRDAANAAKQREGSGDRGEGAWRSGASSYSGQALAAPGLPRSRVGRTVSFGSDEGGSTQPGFGGA